MLPFLEELLEKKLSELLGADVRFDRFKASPLSGKVEVLNLSAKAPEAEKPFLTIARIEAKIAIARALKQEVAIESLRIERPVIRLPLPVRPRTTSAGTKKEGSKPWQFEADDVLIVDATIEYDNNRYHAIAEHATISLKRHVSAIEVTGMVDSLRRVDPDVSLGSLKAQAQIATGDFSQLMNAAVSLTGEMTSLRLSARSPSIQSKTVEMQLDGGIDPATLAQLLPTPNAMLASFVGAIHLAIDAMISPSRIELRRAEISAENAEWELHRLLKRT